VPPGYSQTLLEHFKRPRNFGSLDARDAAHEDLNPLCGDRIRMEVRLREGRVEAVRFRGDACAIAVASASVLTELATGRTAADAIALDAAAVIAALEAEILPSRLQCVRLPVDVLREALRHAGT
jgi:nitrogen fixation NifU-like protein